MSRRDQAAHVSYGLLCVLLVVACSRDETWRYAAITAANVVPVLVLLVQLRSGTFADRSSWTITFGGVGILLAHNVRNQVVLATTGSPARDVLADGTLALGYLLLLAGAALATLPIARRDLGGMLDAAVIGLASASLVWAVVLQPAHVRLGSSATRTAYELCLVLLVTALAGLVLRAFVVVRAARVTTLLLLLAMASTNLADIVFTLTEDQTTGLSSWWASALCVVALLSFGSALAHPSAGGLAGPEPRPRGLTRARLTFIAIALSVNPAVAGIRALLGGPVDVVLLSIGSQLMVPLVVLRIALLARGYADTAERLHDLASRDELTGLPNRRALTAHLAELLDRIAAGSSPGAVVLYLDLDDFKEVNDTHGHATGDRVLYDVGSRVRACIRSTDLVARCGGDEFVVVLEGDPAVVEAAVVASLGRALAEPVVVGSVVASGRASIGVARVRTGESMAAETLLARADVDMYRVKRASGRPTPTPAPESPLVGSSAPADL